MCLTNLSVLVRESVEKEAEKLSTQADGNCRKNLDHLFVFTIDPEGSKDLDDAMSLERCGKHKGCWKVKQNVPVSVSFSSLRTGRHIAS